MSHLHLLFTLKKAAVGLNGHLALETGLSRTAEPSHRPAGSAFSIDPSADLFLSLQYFLSAASWKFRLCLSRSGLSEYLSTDLLLSWPQCMQYSRGFERKSDVLLVEDLVCFVKYHLIESPLTWTVACFTFLRCFLNTSHDHRRTTRLITVIKLQFGNEDSYKDILP